MVANVETLRQALSQAMGCEVEAQEFYTEARGRIADPRGQDLCQQLADFEGYHYRSLLTHYEALAHAEAPPPYVARELKPSLEAGQWDRGTRNLETAMDVLVAAVRAEEAARARYEEWATQASTIDAQTLFRRLAHEESVHSRIVSDEFYALSNRGLWLWGD
jgi:rubrerythrin